MEYREPPEIDPSKITIDPEIHFIDHRLWDQRCATLPGGRRKHLKMAWRYIWKSDLRAATVCRVGRHRRTNMFRMAGGKPVSVQVVCGDCCERLSAEQPV
ncbi:MULTISPECIES: hypothetical protein [Aeromicrobium]|uniref:hypothetical protein n=1 Tax=Aeromicrobium TaxID=2040 RepID=UPI00257A2B6A|nr:MULTISPECIES: hypothetical protein [Aeromicrobium]